MVKPSSADRQAEKRKIVRETKKVIQQSMDGSSTTDVMSNRISWRKFDRLRKSQTLENSSAISALNQTPSRKRQNVQSDENTPPSKRKHGSLMLPKLMEESLLAEAQTWIDDATVNWSSLARQYGIMKPNGGQLVKDFLRAHDIPAASKEQREG